MPSSPDRRSPPGPVGIGVLVSLLALVFVLGRLVIAADGEISRFVVAGADFVDADTVDPAIHVFPSSGYDGQFYWRLAVDPADHDLGPAHGVRIDQEIRFGRISYPLLAWLGAIGQPSLVVWSLVLVNVIGLGVIAGLAAAFARDHDLSPWCGTLVAASSGFVMTISRDLCEIVMVAGLVGAALAIGRRRPVLAGLGFAVAALTHEQSLVVVGAYGVWRCWTVLRTTRRPARDDLAWVIPAAAFAAWQAVCLVAWGSTPILDSGGKNLDVPFVGLVQLAQRWARGDVASQELLAPAQFLVIAAVVVVAFRAARRDAGDGGQRWLLVATAIGSVLAVSISYNVLKGPAELRTLVIVPTVGWLAMFAARYRPPTWLVGSAAVVCVATVGLRVLAI